MHNFIFLLTIPIIATIAIRIWQHRLTWQYFAMPAASPPYDSAPVSMIVPVRGRDPDAEINFRSYCQQEYDAPYEVIFALEDQDDPAVPVIQALMASYPAGFVRLIYSRDVIGIGKIKNQIAAARTCQYDLWVLVDSDVHLAPDFLQSQAAAIMEGNEVGLAYAAPCAIGSEDWVAALHNIAVCSSVLQYGSAAKRNTLTAAVGSCIVTRRDVIDDIGGLESIGEHVIGLDVSLGRAVIQANYKIKLLTKPARIYHRHDRLARFWWQSHRWLATINQYVPHFWIIVIVLALPFWWALAFLGTAIAIGLYQEIGVGLIVLTLLADLISAAVINHRLAHDSNLWKYLWVALFGQIFLLPNLIASVGAKKVKWRDRWLTLESTEKIG